MGSPGQRIPPPVDPGVSTRNADGIQGRLFKVPIEIGIPDDPNLIIEEHVIDVFVPDIDSVYEPVEISSYDLKGWSINRTNQTKEPVIITIRCNLTYWPPTRPGINVGPGYIQRAIWSNTDPNSRLQQGSYLFEEKFELQPDRTRTPKKLTQNEINNVTNNQMKEKQLMRPTATVAAIRKLPTRHDVHKEPTRYDVHKEPTRMVRNPVTAAAMGHHQVQAHHHHHITRSPQVHHHHQSPNHLSPHLRTPHLQQPHHQHDKDQTAKMKRDGEQNKKK